MSPELERRLVEKFPKLYAGYNKSPTMSLMAFGFECDDGWFDLIDKLSEYLASHAEVFAAKHPPGAFSGSFTVSQVKEKYGTLRFYIGPCTDEGLAVIHFAESMSARICETCGTRGRLRGGVWLKTLCDVCAEKQGFADDEPKLQ